MTYAGILQDIFSYSGPLFELVGASQWMVLTNDFLTQTRTDPEIIKFLAVAEWMPVPDEFYYATVANEFANSSISWKGPTFTRWNHTCKPADGSNHHPFYLDEHPDLAFDAIANGYLFARKICKQQSKFIERVALIRTALGKS